jgi:outer membrane protein OmpA-like peptidoglycan-associated protein
MIATAAFVIFLMPAFSLRANEAAQPLPGAKGEIAIDSSAEPAAPMSSSSRATAMPYSGGSNMGAPKVELFLGYSYLRAVPALAAGNRLVWMNGGSANIAYNFNRYLGIVADVGAFTNSEIKFTGAYKATIDVDNSNVGVLTYLFGPRLSLRQYSRITPFAQVLFGGVHANQVTISNCTSSCILLPDESAFAMTAGGGLDLRVHRHFAIRIIQAEYLMTRFQDYTTGATVRQNDMRLSSGIVFRFGRNAAFPTPPPSPVTYFCSVTPPSVFPGEPIAASGTALNLNPAKTEIYTWSVDGGTVSGTLNTAKINTTDLAPGAYTLKCHVSQGDKPGENADATAPYVVKAYEPPTVSCTANPQNVISGGSSTITAIGVSPQNRPLTYSYSSTAGSVSGSGSTALLSTTDVPVGPVTVTCNVADDKNQTASGTTLVTVAAPTVVLKPMTSDLCSIHFDRDARRPSRVDNEAKACLDEIALNLQHNSDAKLAIVGNAANEEKNSRKLAVARAVNTKTYLVSEKGIDSSRIAVYTDSQNARIVTTILIPAGATLDASGDTPVE